MSEASNRDRRHFSRVNFDRSVTVEWHDKTFTGQIEDLSLKGLLVYCPEAGDIPLGDKAKISFSLGETGVEITMRCELAHHQDKLVGLHCITIDIDSMTHLRRIIELNTGTDELLQREFSALLEDDS